MIAAVIQITSGSDPERNLETATHWIERAAQAGAQLIALPENLLVMREEFETGPNPFAQDLDGPLTRLLRDLARRLGVVIAGGTFPERTDDVARVYNTSILVDSDGEIRGVYRKIHLFDVELPDASLRESRTVAPGSELVVADTSLGAIGLSVCYDMRFPAL